MEGIVMFNEFFKNSPDWAYVALSKLAKLNGGPQKLLNAVHNAGQVQGFIKLLSIEAGGLVGGVVTWGVMELLSMKNGKHGSNISTNSYVDCPECGTRFEHRSGSSLGCPNCNWGITDQEFEDGEYDDGFNFR